MDRVTLQAIAQAKLDDAELLFQHGRFANAYYLFGYAAEIAIKARIASMFRADTIPDKKIVDRTYSHNLSELVKLAGLSMELDVARQNSPEFDSHWSTATGWIESSRYDMIDVFRATAMRNAMMDPNEGVFRWLRERW